MIAVIYPPNERSFTTNGLGSLPDALTGYVEKSINSVNELSMTYPMGGHNADKLTEGNIICVWHDDSKTIQPYEINKVTRTLKGKITVNAWHISYKLRKLTCRPFSGENLPSALGAFEHSCMTESPFTFTTTRTTAVPMTISQPCAMRSVMGGMAGSFLDVYGGEWDFDRFECILKDRLGTNTGYRIEYGNNLTDISKKTDYTNLWSGIVPFWIGEKPEDSVYYDGVIYSQYSSMYYEDMVIPVDCSSDFEEAPTQEQMLTWGQNYVARNEKSNLPQQLKVSFVGLWETEEYKDIAFLQRLFLGDSVSVVYPDMGVDTTARIVATKYDWINERYEDLTIGSVSSNIAQTLKQETKDTRTYLPSRSWVRERLSDSTNKITGGLGGYVVMNLDADGHPQEIIVMDSPDKETAVNCIRINREGIGFSQNGYNPPGGFTSAWTIDGHFDATFITAGILNADLMRAGTISSADGSTWWDLEHNQFYLAAQGGTIQGSDIETENTTAGVRGDVADILQHFQINDDASLQIITSNGMSITLSQGTVTVTDSASNSTIITGTEVTAGVLNATDSIYIGNHRLLARSNGTNTTVVYTGD